MSQFRCLLCQVFNTIVVLFYKIVRRVKMKTLVDCLIIASHTIRFDLCFADTLRSGQIDKHGRRIYNLLCVLIFFNRSGID